jgi:hypothetical protein
MVLLFSVWIVTNFAFTTRSLAALQQAYPAVRAPVRFVWLLAFILTIVLFYVFPDGRFVPRWTQLLVAAGVVLVVLSPGLPEDMLNLPDTPEGVSVLGWRATILAWLGLWCTGMLAQVYRYRRVSGPVERQQAKWVMFTLSLFMTIIGLGFVIPSLFWDLPDVWFAAVLLTAAPLGIVLPVSIAMAILRYRLYDIDRVISRTVAYAILTALLGAVYAGGGASPGAAVRWNRRRATDLGSGQRHLSCGRPLPAGPPPHPAGGGPPLQPPQVRCGKDGRGVQPPFAGRGRPQAAAYTPEEFGRLLAAALPFYRDHLIVQAGTGLRSGELLGLRAHRVDLDMKRLEAVEVRYDAGRFGSGYKARPKSDTSIRPVPMASLVVEAVRRRLEGCPPDGLVFCGPGGSHGVKRGVRSQLSVRNYRRAYRLAASRAGLDGLDLHGPHDLRHTFATWLEDAGVPVRVNR